MSIATEGKEIRRLSPAYIGTSHDFSILKTEFPPCRDWFATFHVKVDLGYLGIAKDYARQTLSIPHKKTKEKPLSERQKDENRRMASERVCVEHGFAGLKRFRVLSDRLRLHRLDFYDVILGVCAGLWNFYLAN